MGIMGSRDVSSLDSKANLRARDSVTSGMNRQGKADSTEFPTISFL
jgi:hypothetical protein